MADVACALTVGWLAQDMPIKQSFGESVLIVVVVVVVVVVVAVVVVVPSLFCSTAAPRILQVHNPYSDH